MKQLRLCPNQRAPIRAVDWRGAFSLRASPTPRQPCLPTPLPAFLAYPFTCLQPWRTPPPHCWRLPMTTVWPTCGPLHWTTLCTTLLRWHRQARVGLVSRSTSRVPPLAPAKGCSRSAPQAAARLAAPSLNRKGVVEYVRPCALIPLPRPGRPRPAAESYQALSRRQVALVAEEACAAHASTLAHIKRMADLPALPPPSY